MVIRYYTAPDVKRLVDKMVADLHFTHINPDCVYCFRSEGSKSRRTVARIHSLEKLWQKALKTAPRYLIEVIGERYDKLSQANQEKVLIHELLHIPKGFSGGFKPHKGYIDEKTINRLHHLYTRQRTSAERSSTAGIQSLTRGLSLRLKHASKSENLKKH
ncbi:MAG: metallopeptidase [Candidatus Bathyarchaeota archaeon]|nr:MAG: metallopeptidase [Candidatus Bathyarchaeota archaeon]